MDHLLFALWLGLALAVGLVAHEYAHALAADRLGDPSPRRWGRLTLDPRRLVDPFGTLILPGLILLLVAAGRPALPPFAYARPMPLDEAALRNRDRDATLVALAGPAASLALAVVAGLLLRLRPPGEVGRALYAVLLANLWLALLNLMPVPGLDGARILARFLPPRAREVYRNLDPYLPLFVLVIFFLFGSLLGIVDALVRAVCRVAAGGVVPC